MTKENSEEKDRNEENELASLFVALMQTYKRLDDCLEAGHPTSETRHGLSLALQKQMVALISAINERLAAVPTAEAHAVASTLDEASVGIAQIDPTDTEGGERLRQFFMLALPSLTAILAGGIFGPGLAALVVGEPITREITKGVVAASVTVAVGDAVRYTIYKAEHPRGDVPTIEKIKGRPKATPRIFTGNKVRGNTLNRPKSSSRAVNDDALTTTGPDSEPVEEAPTAPARPVDIPVAPTAPARDPARTYPAVPKSSPSHRQ